MSKLTQIAILSHIELDKDVRIYHGNRVAMPLESPIKVLVEIGKSFLTNNFKWIQ